MSSYMGSYKSVKMESDIPVRMRDGTVLKADIFRPDASGKFPVILHRVPYNKESPRLRADVFDNFRAASQGYVVVVQDCRGRYKSEGEFSPFFQEIDDGYDSVQWCASQPWSTGKVGMVGRSYGGATQWLAACSAPPSLVAIAPTVTASQYYDGWTYQNGALALGFAVSWTTNALTLSNLDTIARNKRVPKGTKEKLTDVVDNLPEAFRHMPIKDYPHLKNGLAPYFYDWISHPSDDSFWAGVKVEDYYPKINVAALNIGGWHDIFLKGTLRNFTSIRTQGGNERARRGQKLIIGPWYHGPLGSVSGETYFGLRAAKDHIDLDGITLRWFDYWLKDEDNGIMDETPVRLFVMGLNRWRDEQEWPLTRAQNVQYFLHSAGKANSLNGDGVLSTDTPSSEPSDVYVYDPREPVPSRGGGLCCFAHWVVGGAYDQRSVEARPDVLVYTTPPLERDVEVTGPVTVTLYASSSAPDTDFTAKLVDVCPCGCATNLTDGIVRARYRESLSEPKLIQPGLVCRYTIDLVATSNVFKKGHRIRVEISSSNFPRFDRNPNTGREPWEETELKPALQTVFHDSEYPSHIALPVVPRE